MTNSPAASTPSEATGEVFDLGYRPFEGSREGRFQALRAIWRDSIRASLGLGRSLSSKLLPIIIIGLAFAPAVVMMVIIGFVASFGGDTEEFGLPSNAEYYGFASVPLMLFGAALGPEMFCPDRRSGVLVLYLVRPLTVRDYLVARWVGFFTVSVGILWLPQLLLFATRAFTAENPLEWLQDHPALLGQIALSGISLAALLTTVSLAVSSFTDRRPYAAATILGLLIGSIVVSEIAAAIAGGDSADWLELLNLLLPADYLNGWIFREGGGPLSPDVYIGQLFAIVSLGWAVLWWRYRGASS
jgi:ABC-2 type transport system permease protein